MIRIENRYTRQIGCTPGFDQQKIQGATVLIAGVGGLGCSVSMLLAAAGIGTLLLCDHDTVSISNLNRQLLYTEQDLGMNKAVTAAKKLKEFNPDTVYLPIKHPFSEEALKALPRPTIIMDCLDNLEARVDLIRYANLHGIPLVHAAVQELSGQISSFIPPLSTCPVCALSGHETDDSEAPLSLGACVTTIAGYQSSEAIKLLSNIGEPSVGKITLFDLLTNTIEELRVIKDPACIACGKHHEDAR